MSEKLKDLMDRTAAIDFAPVDLDTITAAGDRTVRRRRLALGAGALALVLAAGAAVAVSGRGDDREHVAQDPTGAPLGAPTWVRGSKLHTPTASYELGHEVAGYVRTTAGYAFLDTEGRVYSYVGGKVERIGETATEDGLPTLVTGEGTSIVGWVGRSGRNRFVAHDLATGQHWTFGDVRAVRSGDDSLDTPEEIAVFRAVDGRTAFVVDSRGEVAVQLDSGAVRVVRVDGNDEQVVDDAAGGQIAFVRTSDTSISVGSETTTARPLAKTSTGSAGLSSDGRWYLGSTPPTSKDLGEDGFQIVLGMPVAVEIATGRRVRLDIQGHGIGRGVHWLDDDTALVMARDEGNSPVELMACEVRSGECAVVASIGRYAEGKSPLHLATGLSFDF
ncbi:hypothetical protein [Nocardioides sp. LML1-1-1.1]|uniref:hypothetical protein n=1 Tax=Nocardioides sp. LML1-1-1.1 TaxID=3135248 RepID=UPI003432C7C9